MGIITQAIDFLASNPLYLILGILVYVVLFLLSIFMSRNKSGKNPFKFDARKKPAELVIDQAKRDKILKQGFAAKKLDSSYDAIVIGSGIGGLTTASILAKAGKKVLVLEQHDQAGGCCHTFVEDGYEFDVGIHYIGEMQENTIVRFLFDQITQGQLQWTPLDQEYDKVAIGKPGEQKLYSILSNKDAYKQALLKHFPKEEKAIDGYLKLLVEARRSMMGFIMVKAFPKFIAKILIKLGLIHYMSPYFKKISSKSVQQVVESLTNNKDLQLIFAYNFGDYGTLPDEASWAMQAVLANHYLYGAFYPLGGASEIAFHIIPTIEKSGGKVLVRAPVSKILVDSMGKANGVRISKTGGDIDLKAPIIISDAGINNTLHKLLDNEVAVKSPLYKSMTNKHIKAGMGCLSLFVGLKGSSKELGIKGQNIWAYTNADVNKEVREYYNKSEEDFLDGDFPLLFIGFPSAKDPAHQKRYPGKTTCTVITMAKWDWFSSWKDERVKHRGGVYEEKKELMKEKMWKQVLALYPQLKDCVEYMDLGTPLSNNFYIGALEGETYGLDHNMKRFASAEVAMNLRPDIGVPGLYITGQDLFSAGLVGAAMGGVITAAACLNRQVFNDLTNLKKECKKSQ
ncbi:DgyrCDS9997 [Dimorphilus gyrociliatus]|uniref:DgyrCDS9997 n=1 Tax=Dimorphilus gyrociliatus TaxID=2664684 RepID=A0A7I8W0B7_9ANNE|nr:DgyrCDS9997 [Dimorphilus gyrociliatus]